METKVICMRDTRKVVVVQCDDKWILPKEMELTHYKEGQEPVFIKSDSGDVYLKGNEQVANS